ncbi:MAG TPA: lysine--tRNA ligase [Thermoanaerobaculia bacterium]|nr:lysine--tRNA ligase [Thermoanaerobaculia bacterium]
MSELDDQIRNRRAKREALGAMGVEAYPARAAVDLEPEEVHARYGAHTAAEWEAEGVELRVPGRLRAVRDMGKTRFLDLHDGRAKLQLLVRTARLDDASRALLEQLDLGDYLLARGRLIRTRAGELSLDAAGLTMLAKALRPMPEKWHGLADLETRYRQRYLDLVANPESRRVFELRAALVRGIRAFLDARGYLEVETPMMQHTPGGATARPFVTHHNALDLDLYLRVAPELFLKRLLVGGLHRVYEINRNFRNEGISTQHNPEFTMLEFYCAYSDYLQLMDLIEEMLGTLAREVVGGEDLPHRGETLRLGARPWPRLSMRGAVAAALGVAEAEVDTAPQLAAWLERLGLERPPALAPGLPPGEQPGAYGHLLMALFEARVEPGLVQPTFVTDHPVEVSPLAKPRRDDPRFTERFELYLGGMEIANAFSELNDPDVQAERFREQLRARAAGDDEAHRFDDDFVRALEHGMPPAGGAGIGIDRLTMLFADRSSIRDVILFPLLRPERG